MSTGSRLLEPQEPGPSSVALCFRRTTAATGLGNFNSLCRWFISQISCVPPLGNAVWDSSVSPPSIVAAKPHSRQGPPTTYKPPSTSSRARSYLWCCCNTATRKVPYSGPQGACGSHVNRRRGFSDLSGPAGHRTRLACHRCPELWKEYASPKTY